MRLRVLLLGPAALLAVAGLWHIGGGLHIHVKALAAQYLLANAWAETLSAGSPTKPWPWADTWPIARLLVPAHGIDLIVLSGASGRTLAFGPGHVDGTAPPGKAGLSVIGGHRDTHFRFLQKLVPGERIIVERPDGVSHVYRVAVAGAIHKDLARVAIRPDRTTLVLATCWPFDAVVPGGPMRYVVTAEGLERGDMVSLPGR